jgi:hypothetical protein
MSPYSQIRYGYPLVTPIVVRIAKSVSVQVRPGEAQIAYLTQAAQTDPKSELFWKKSEKNAQFPHNRVSALYMGIQYFAKGKKHGQK